MINDPDIIFLDGPTTGLDPVGRARCAIDEQPEARGQDDLPLFASAGAIRAGVRQSGQSCTGATARKWPLYEELLVQQELREITVGSKHGTSNPSLRHGREDSGKRRSAAGRDGQLITACSR